MEQLLMNEKGWKPYKAGPIDSLNNISVKMVDMNEVDYTYYFKGDHQLEVQDANDGKSEKGNWRLNDSNLTFSFINEAAVPVKIVRINEHELIWDQLGIMRVHLKPVQ